MFGLLKVIAGASQAKQDIMGKFMGPDSLYGKAAGAIGDLEKSKNEMFNPGTTALGALGFGQADQLRGVGQIPKIQEFQAGDTAKMMQKSLASIGATIPAANMVSLGAMDLSTPDLTSPFVEAPPIDFDTAAKRETEMMLMEEASQGRGMLEDPNNFTPTPEAGMLRMS